jgi:hypothetical protein
MRTALGALLLLGMMAIFVAAQPARPTVTQVPASVAGPAAVPCTYAALAPSSVRNMFVVLNRYGDGGRVHWKPPQGVSERCSAELGDADRHERVYGAVFVLPSMRCVLSLSALGYVKHFDCFQQYGASAGLVWSACTCGRW